MSGGTGGQEGRNGSPGTARAVQKGSMNRNQRSVLAAEHFPQFLDSVPISSNHVFAPFCRHGNQPFIKDYCHTSVISQKPSKSAAFRDRSSNPPGSRSWHRFSRGEIHKEIRQKQLYEHNKHKQLKSIADMLFYTLLRQHVYISHRSRRGEDLSLPSQRAQPSVNFYPLPQRMAARKRKQNPEAKGRGRNGKQQEPGRRDR